MGTEPKTQLTLNWLFTTKRGGSDFRLVFGDFTVDPDHVLNLRDPVEVVMTHSWWADSSHFDHFVTREG